MFWVPNLAPWFLSPQRGCACSNFWNPEIISSRNAMSNKSRSDPRTAVHTNRRENLTLQRVTLIHGVKSPRVRALKVGTGKCGRDGNGTVREWETVRFFVPDRDFPTGTIVSFCSRALPSRGNGRVPVPDCFPSHCLPIPDYSRPAVRPVPTIPIPLSCK